MRVTLTIPVFNEEKRILNCLQCLNEYQHNSTIIQRVVIALNGCTDNTKKIIENFSEFNPNFKFSIFETKTRGRGYVLKKVWSEYESDVHAYIDADMSIEISELVNIIKPILENEADVCIGDRFNAKSKVRRSKKRTMLSAGLVKYLRFLFNSKTNDFQCGFKAFNTKKVKNVISKTVNNNWFFDTEFLVFCENSGLKIKGIPINWVEKNDTKVKFIKTVLEFIFESIRLKFRLKINAISKHLKLRNEI